MTTTGHTSLLVTQQALYTMLTSSSNFTAISGGPYDPAPLNTPFPYVTFGNHIESNWYQFGRTSKMVDIILHIYSQQPTYAEAYTILDVINTIIEAKTLALPDNTFSNVAVIFQSATKIDEGDGLTRHIEARWRTWNNAN